jgi:hypothetical protein
VETIVIKYRKLFQVEVLLHHLLDEAGTLFDDLEPLAKVRKLGGYDLRQWMGIEPTTACREALAGQGWVFKTTPTGFLVVASANVDGPAKPANPPSETLVLDFEMAVNDGSFGKSVALPVPGKLDGQRAVYLFDNRDASIDGASFPDLALVPLTFSLTTEYQPGDIVRSAGKRFFAKTKNLGISTSDGTRWQEITENFGYANAAQLSAGGTLPVSAGAFGLIRLHFSSGLADFGLLDNGNLRSPVFKIRLKKMAA